MRVQNTISRAVKIESIAQPGRISRDTCGLRAIPGTVENVLSDGVRPAAN